MHIWAVGRMLARWRRDMDEATKAVCKEAFGDFLQELGYPVD